MNTYFRNRNNKTTPKTGFPAHTHANEMELSVWCPSKIKAIRSPRTSLHIVQPPHHCTRWRWVGKMNVCCLRLCYNRGERGRASAAAQGENEGIQRRPQSQRASGSSGNKSSYKRFPVGIFGFYFSFMSVDALALAASLLGHNGRYRFLYNSRVVFLFVGTY